MKTATAASSAKRERDGRGVQVNHPQRSARPAPEGTLERTSYVARHPVGTDRLAATAVSLVIIGAAWGAAPAMAAPKPPINYFQPIPIVGKLSTTVWGASTVGPRDPASGLEDNGATGGVGPQQENYYYWDGKLVKGEDGKYHLYVSHWAHSNGFGGWGQSIPYQAVSDNIIGPYVAQGDCYTKNSQGNNKGHNVTAVVAPTGTSPFTLVVGEIVPGQMFASSSANGPWTLLGLVQTNSNGHNCGSLSSNFTLTVGPDMRFWATSRGGCVMDSDQVLGPYKVETNSVLPNLENNDNGNAEDQAIWYSGGYFHVVYNYWNVRRAYHIMSKDGVSNWQSTGLAYQGAQSPLNANSNWLRYSDGTVNHWYNLERPSVYLENGHVTHFTFAATDLNKDQSSMINTGSSKVLVVPFNGVQFDCDNGDAVSCQQASMGGTGGSAAAGAGGSGDGGGGQGGASGALGTGGGGMPVDSGTTGSGGLGGMSAGAGGLGGDTGAGTGGVAGTAGGTTAGGGTLGTTPDPGTAGHAGSAGATRPSGDGCACRVSSLSRGDWMCWLALAAAIEVIRRRARGRRRSSERT